MFPRPPINPPIVINIWRLRIISLLDLEPPLGHLLILEEKKNGLHRRIRTAQGPPPSFQS